MDFVPIPLLLSEAINPDLNEPNGRRNHRFINKAFTEQIGYDLEDMPDFESYFAKAYPDADYRADRLRDWHSVVEQSERNGQAKAETQSLIQCKNGEKRWFIVTAELHSHIQPNCHMVAFRDVHDLHMGLQEHNRLSRTDALTDLPNRRDAQERLSLEVDRFARSGTPFSLLLCDIDYFKEINDTYGHAIGDLALCAVANHLRQCCRTIDCVSRWGGEEFLIVMPQTDLPQAIELAERIRQSLESHALNCQGIMLSMKLSIGCATATTDQSAEKLLNLTDAALYHAKRTGRNKVCTTAQAPESVI